MGQPEAMAMLLQEAHLVLPGFPHLDEHLTAQPRAGERVGPVRLHRQLRQGAFGTVFAAVNEETQEFEAVEVIEKNGIADVGPIKSVWKELRTLQLLNHANVVACYGALQGPDHLYIRTEHLGGGSLFRGLMGRQFEAADAQRFQAQLMSAVSYCHGNQVAHGDLKPENLGLCLGRPLVLKVMNFGSSRRTDTHCHHPIGTFPFMAPEVLEASEAAPFQITCSDVFATGVILLEMLCGIGKLTSALGWQVQMAPSPALAAELRDLLQDTTGLAEALETDLGLVPPELLRLLVGLLRADPVRRWTAARALRSPWLQQHGVAEAARR